MDGPSIPNTCSENHISRVGNTLAESAENPKPKSWLNKAVHQIALNLCACLPTKSLKASIPQPALHRFGQRAVVSSNTDLVVDQAARNLANTRKVSPHNRFNLTANGRTGNVFATSNLMSGILNGQRPLIHLTRHDRLDFVGHGNETHFEDYTPAMLADYVVASGLQEIGVIKLAACEIGKGQFLEEFAQALINRGVRFGYLSAPKSFSSDMRFTFKAFNRDRTVTPFFFLPRKFSGPLPEKFNMKTIKGNLDISFKDSRYKQ